MSRFEMVNYDELEKMSYNGGADADLNYSLTNWSTEVCAKVTNKVCIPFTLVLNCRDVSKRLTKQYDCGHCPVIPIDEARPGDL